MERLKYLFSWNESQFEVSRLVYQRRLEHEKYSYTMHIYISYQNLNRNVQHFVCEFWP